jgi:hypothetical protein
VNKLGIPKETREKFKELMSGKTFVRNQIEEYFNEYFEFNKEASERRALSGFARNIARNFLDSKGNRECMSYKDKDGISRYAFVDTINDSEIIKAMDTYLEKHVKGITRSGLKIGRRYKQLHKKWEIEGQLSLINWQEILNETATGSDSL